ncbi:UGMP family protein, partial [Candidatus Bathyarchaeota archaeon]|nr:UGMP family protein [Candidatus Bathyarchaeota archaeon]NIV43884.1 UGMP family protein [Candidatus Bathyarchaeota archaeon]
MATQRKADSYCLGLESTADDFSVGILSFTGEILANEVSMFMPETGGIHPREAARHHAEVAGRVLSAALQKAGIQPRDITIVAFSQGPGLGPCLRT